MQGSPMGANLKITLTEIFRFPIFGASVKDPDEE